jgi:hypothetical protein
LSGRREHASTQHVARQVIHQAFQRKVLPLLSPVARIAPSGLNATEMTEEVLESVKVASGFEAEAYSHYVYP